MKTEKNNKEKTKGLPKVHPDLKGFDIKVNEFGEIESTFSIEKINLFLNKKVVDKKLKDRFGYKSDENDQTVEFMYGEDPE